MRITSKGTERVTLANSSLLFDEMNRDSAGLVSVTIDPADPGTVALDADGRLFHCVIIFPRPPSADVPGYRQFGIYAADGFSPDINRAAQPVEVECDGGAYYLPSTAQLQFVGGKAGDEYDVSVTVDYPRRMPDGRFEAWLTGHKPAAVREPPVFGKYHSLVRLLAGGAEAGGAALSPLVEIPRGWPVVLGTANEAFYQVGVRL